MNPESPQSPPPSLLYLTKRLETATHSSLERVCTPHSLTVTQLTLLSTVEMRGAMTNADIARRLSIRPQSVTDVVRSLQERSWITRTPDPDNGRRILNTVSPGGRALLQTIDPELSEVQATMLSGFDEAQATLLRDLMLRATRNLQS